jgi:hypothetical protein
LRILTVAFALLLMLPPNPTRSRSDSVWTIYLRGAGPLRIGMAIGEVRRALNDPAASLYVSDPANPLGENGCTYLESRAVPPDVGVLLERKRVVRIDVYAKFRTASGAGVGDSEDRIRGLYPGRITVETHRYDPNGHYLIFTAADRADQPYGLVFETDGKVVTQYRSGLRHAIAWAEGCS